MARSSTELKQAVFRAKRPEYVQTRAPDRIKDYRGQPTWCNNLLPLINNQDAQRNGDQT